jgi:hypothetical protein
MPITFEKALIARYNEIVNDVSKRYGKSQQTGSLNNINSINESRGLNRTDTWEPNDSLKIYAYITVSNYYKKDQFITINPTHKIRVYVNNLKPEKPQSLDSTQIKVLDATFNNLLQLLSTENFEEAKKAFSPIIIETVTNDILKQVKQNIKFDKKLELFMNGFQFLQDETHIQCCNIDTQTAQTLPKNTLWYCSTVTTKS